MFSDKRMTAALLIVNALLLTLVIAVEMSDRGAWAQAPSAGVGPTMTLLAGYPSPNQDEPIYVIDSRNEVICVYEYNPGTRKFGLKSARTYKYDKQLIELGNERPSVDDVREGRMTRPR
jgi:hypothetical protein